MEQKLLKIIEKELKKLYKGNKLTLINKKIYLDFKFINILSRSTEFTKNTYAANNLFKKLKKHRVISKKSILYPKNIKFVSSNPLDRSFLLVNLRTYDKTILLKNAFLLNEESENLSDIEFKKPYSLIFGNEGSGLGKEYLKSNINKVIIEQGKEVDSLNLTIAVGIGIYKGIRSNNV